jgi:hypothetical protein
MRRLFVAVFILSCIYGPAQAQHKLTAKQYEDAIVGIEARIEELQREIAAEAGWTVAEVALVAGISMYAPIVMGGEIPGGVEAIKECLEKFLHGKAAFETYEKWRNLQTLQNEGLRDAWGNLLRYYPAEYRRVTSARNNPMMAFYHRQSVLRKQGAAAAAHNKSCPAGKGGGNHSPKAHSGGEAPHAAGAPPPAACNPQPPGCWRAPRDGSQIICPNAPPTEAQVTWCRQCCENDAYAFCAILHCASILR